MMRNLILMLGLLPLLAATASATPTCACHDDALQHHELPPFPAEVDFNESIAAEEAATRASKLGEPVAYNPDLSTHNPSPVSTRIGGPIASSVTELDGALSDRIIFLMPGHGWTFDSPGLFQTQRVDLLDMIEDFGNADQVTIVADYLVNAGATVVPLRPFGIQENEVVLDNDDPTVTFNGSWSNSGSSAFYGTSGDIPYRFASTTTGAATATAVYDASTLMPTTDFYPVYVWTRWGTDRINQQYLVEHSGGTTSRRINHQMVGSGWMYLGTFYFETGGPASVTITNVEEVGDPGGVVIADAVRFGNGMGDARLEGEASGFPRHEENGEFWFLESKGIGSGLIEAGSVSSPPRLAAHMNYTAGGNSGAYEDRVYLSYHSNAGGGSARGADGLFNNNPGDDFDDPATANANNTVNTVDFAIELGTVLNTDMTTISNSPNDFLPTNWGQTGAGTNIFGSGSAGGGGFTAYGEFRASNLSSEMAGTIIEVAFHDNSSDTLIMRDPRGREAIARSTVHATINFFNTFSGSLGTYPPEQPDNPWVVSDNSGNLTLNWIAPTAGGLTGTGGGAATEYIVEVSQNGRGFTELTRVTPPATNVSVTSAVPLGATRYFRVVALNAGGVSSPSIVVGARRTSAKAPVLVVNGYDRYDRLLNRRRTQSTAEVGGDGTFDRVIPRFNNRFDYVVEMGDALSADTNGFFDSCQNEQIISGAVLLTDYDAVFWILGSESTADRSFDNTERGLVQTYLNGNGNLFLSGAETAWDLGRTSAAASDITFLETYLKVARFTASNPEDDAGVYSANGVGGTIFQSVGSLSFSDGSDVHGDFDVDFPDILNPIAPAVTALRYTDTGSSSAAIVSDDRGNNRGRVVFLGFPLEVVLDATDREAIILAALDFFDVGSGTSVDGWRMY
jgi:hypothetical protein